MIAIDTSVVVAALVTTHESHGESLSALQAALESPPVVVPGAVLLESYSVLTRLPAPMRLSPASALRLLRHAFHGCAEVPELDAGSAWALLAEAVGGALAGGIIHDAHIAACARRAGATRVLTLNPRHFARVAADLGILTP